MQMECPCPFSKECWEEEESRDWQSKNSCLWDCSWLFYSSTEKRIVQLRHFNDFLPKPGSGWASYVLQQQYTVEETASCVNALIELERFWSNSNSLDQTLSIKAYNQTLSIEHFQLNAFNQMLSIERFGLNTFNWMLAIKRFQNILDVHKSGNFFHCAATVENELYFKSFCTMLSLEFVSNNCNILLLLPLSSRTTWKIAHQKNDLLGLIMKWTLGPFFLSLVDDDYYTCLSR